MKRKVLCSGLLPGVLLAALLFFSTRTTRAQVFLKPSGKKAIPVRVQSVLANVEIIGGFAVTKWQIKFAPDTARYQDEIMDFVMARPSDAKLTALRVGQENKGLDGRVVENAVALPRVKFPAAKDDPLYKSGLNPNNSLRATIYPMSYWNEVAVSGTWVQVLSENNGRAVYSFPLRAMRGATTRLNDLSVRVSIRDGEWQRVSSNFNLPAKTQGDSRILNLGQKNYRPTRDLQINLARGSTPAAATMLFAPNAAKTGGHFIVSLTAESAMKNPQVSFSGLNASQIVLSSDTLRAGQTLLIGGVYQGAPKNVALQIATPDGKRALKVLAVQNAIAPALWATQQINVWSKNAKVNRAGIIRLSREYSIASPFSSWLIVGDEDLRIYQRVLVSSQLDPLVREWWIRFADGNENSARSLQLKKAIAQISDASGFNTRDEMHIRLGSAYEYVLSQKYSDYDSRTGKANKAWVTKRIERLGERMLAYLRTQDVKNPRRSIDWASPIYGGELYDLRTKIMNEYRKPQPDYDQLEKWEKRFTVLYGSTSKTNPQLDLWRARITSMNLDTQYIDAKKSGDKTKLAQLEKARVSNSRNAYFVNNIGDPPIYVSASADAKQVVAVMPDGQIKTLEYNARQKRWEGNYDIPTSMREGDYAIQIIVVRADNSRTLTKLKFRVDTTPPTGSGQVLVASQTSEKKDVPLRLEVEHGGDVARVTALLPWGEKVAMLPSTTHGHTFFALARAPQEYSGKAIRVRYVLVDRAHNLTTIEAEAVSKPEAAPAKTP